MVVMWLLPVMMFSYELWPTTDNVSKDEVYAQLKPDDVRRLAPLKPVGMLRPFTPPPGYALQRLPPAQPVDIEGHQVYFDPDVSPDDVNQTTRAYMLILSHILSVKRATFIGRMFAFWIAPAIALYLVGWTIAWVRRGFRQVA